MSFPLLIDEPLYVVFVDFHHHMDVAIPNFTGDEEEVLILLYSDVDVMMIDYSFFIEPNDAAIAVNLVD